ncbi:MAG: desulfoferrodoxin family protein [Planctomycetota bacterium]
MGEEGRDLFCCVNTPEDPENLTDLEKKHIPVITAPDEVKAGECFEVTVEVGKLLEHPNERDHFINFVDLYCGEVFLARLDLTPVTTCPVLRACVQLEAACGPLKAYEFCNQHGTWTSSKEIAVAE